MNTLAAGLTRYFSEMQIRALSAVNLGIVGAGGLGSNVAMLLARSGIKNMTLVDPDIVDASNLNRQAYWPDDVGHPKVLALSRHLLALEPSLRITAHELAVTRVNAAQLFLNCPIIVEAVDKADIKTMLYETFAPGKLLYVTASGMGGYGVSREYPMTYRNSRPNVVIVGDFTRAVDKANPPLAPRVMQAAAMQADAVLAFIVSSAPKE